MFLDVVESIVDNLSPGLWCCSVWIIQCLFNRLYYVILWWHSSTTPRNHPKTRSGMTIVTTFSRQNNAGSRAHYLVSRTSRPRSHPRLRIQRCLLPLLLLYDYHDHHHSHLYCHCILPLPLPLPLRSTKFFYGYHHLLMTVTAALVTAFITPCRQLQCCCY